MTKWLIALAVAVALSMAILVGARFSRPPVVAPAEAVSGVPLFKAPPFSFSNQAGAVVSLGSLKGKVWVANFIFTSCRTICPLLTAKMVQLQRQLAGADVRFLSFSVDPLHDTAEVLAAYAKRWAPTEDRWHLLATTEATLPALALGFHITAKPSEPGALDPILHSSVFVLVDQNGSVRGVYDSEHGNGFRELAQAMRVLSNSPPPPNQGVELDGASLYHALSCASCHENAALAPAIFGLAGRRRDLENGLSATFDDAHVKESIVLPELKRTRGYPLKMPSYEGLVTPPQLEALTSYVLTTPAVGSVQADEVPVFEDPVCHMKVRASPDALREPVDGGTAWFCSAHCRRQFLLTPSAYHP